MEDRDERGTADVRKRVLVNEPCTCGQTRIEDVEVRADAIVCRVTGDRVDGSAERRGPSILT